jgi:hypothetical protein
MYVSPRTSVVCVMYVCVCVCVRARVCVYVSVCKTTRECVRVPVWSSHECALVPACAGVVGIADVPQA